MKRAQTADGVMHEFPDNTPDEVVDRAMKNYTTKGAGGLDPVTTPELPGAAITKDIGTGLIHGAARGAEGTARFVGETLFSSPEDAEFNKQHPPGSMMPFVERHVGAPQTPFGEAAEYVGEAAITSPLQPGGPLTKAVTTIGSGLGSYLGGRAVEGSDIPKPVGEAVGGFVGGFSTGGAAKQATAARARKLLPTSQQNRTAAKDAADTIVKEGIVIDQAEMKRFAAQLRTDLANEPFTPVSSSRTFAAAKNLGKGKGDLASIFDTHSNLGKIPPREGSDWAAAMFARDKIREWVANIPPSQIVGSGMYPQSTARAAQLWELHRDTWRVHSNLEEIYSALESAEWRTAASGAGTNLNTLRQNIRRILDNDNLVRRYDPRAVEAMEQIVEGDIARNTMRKMAKFAPHGPVSAIPVIAAVATGHGDFGAAIAAGGFIAHFFHGRMEQRSLDALLDIIREGSPLTTQKAATAVARARAPIAAVAAGRGSLLGAGADSPLAAPPPEPPPHPGL